MSSTNRFESKHHKGHGSLSSVDWISGAVNKTLSLGLFEYKTYAEDIDRAISKFEELAQKDGGYEKILEFNLKIVGEVESTRKEFNKILGASVERVGTALRDIFGNDGNFLKETQNLLESRKTTGKLIVTMGEDLIGKKSVLIDGKSGSEIVQNVNIEEFCKMEDSDENPHINNSDRIQDYPTEKQVPNPEVKKSGDGSLLSDANNFMKQSQSELYTSSFIMPTAATQNLTGASGGQVEPKFEDRPQPDPAITESVFVEKGPPGYTEVAEMFKKKSKTQNASSQTEPLNTPFQEDCAEMIKWEDICCDTCQCQPIYGPRYHCKGIKDFDQCSGCFWSSEEKNKHNFIRMVKPRKKKLLGFI